MVRQGWGSWLRYGGRTQETLHWSRMHRSTILIVISWRRLIDSSSDCVFALTQSTWCGKCIDGGSTIALVKPLNQWTNVYTNAPTHIAEHHCGIRLRRGVHHGWIQQLVQWQYNCTWNFTKWECIEIFNHTKKTKHMVLSVRWLLSALPHSTLASFSSAPPPTDNIPLLDRLLHPL